MYLSRSVIPCPFYFINKIFYIQIRDPNHRILPKFSNSLEIKVALLAGVKTYTCLPGVLLHELTLQAWDLDKY